MLEKRIAADLFQAGQELLQHGIYEEEKILVVGCSTSEVAGSSIGSASQPYLAEVLLPVLLKLAEDNKLFLAIQCCEHLNRALVVEKSLVRKRNLTEVTVYPQVKAGGSLAHLAMQMFYQPIVVENIQADYGMDLGDTFIGMHLKPVAVPVRSEIKNIGQAHLTMAYSRPKLIGGERAVYHVG